MKIRPIKAADYAEVDRLMQQVQQLHMAARPDLFVPIEHPYSREELSKMIAAPNWICLAAAQDEQLLGICFVELRDHTVQSSVPSAHMHDLCVDSSCRHQGIGKALCLKAQQEALLHGAHSLDLTVWPFNADAIRFYEALGFSTQRYMFEKKLDS